MRENILSIGNWLLDPVRPQLLYCKPVLVGTISLG
jgi:hypothetical protein